MEEIGLLAKTFVLRPYVFVFLLLHTVIALREVGIARTLVWGVIAYAVAFACEWSSIHVGFPFGLYHYFEAPTHDLELWIAGVPFMDSLSFVFLSFTSYATARRLLGRGPEPRGRIEGDAGLVLLAALLMTAIDLVCDPVSLQGDRWFLGRLYDYAQRGAFFGIPLSNFAGWMFVAALTISILATLERVGWLAGEPRFVDAARSGAWAPALWTSIVLFNVAIAFFIELPAVAALGLLFVGVVAARFLRLAASGAAQPRLEQAR